MQATQNVTPLSPGRRNRRKPRVTKPARPRPLALGYVRVSSTEQIEAGRQPRLATSSPGRQGRSHGMGHRDHRRGRGDLGEGHHRPAGADHRPGSPRRG